MAPSYLAGVSPRGCLGSSAPSTRVPDGPAGLLPAAPGQGSGRFQWGNLGRQPWGAGFHIVCCLLKERQFQKRHVVGGGQPKTASVGTNSPAQGMPVVVSALLTLTVAVLTLPGSSDHFPSLVSISSWACLSSTLQPCLCLWGSWHL